MNKERFFFHIFMNMFEIVEILLLNCIKKLTYYKIS